MDLSLALRVDNTEGDQNETVNLHVVIQTTVCLRHVTAIAAILD
jgi:hypothetical protein